MKVPQLPGFRFWFCSIDGNPNHNNLVTQDYVVHYTHTNRSIRLSRWFYSLLLEIFDFNVPTQLVGGLLELTNSQTNKHTDKHRHGADTSHLA